MLRRLVAVSGDPISVETLPQISAHKGKLLSRNAMGKAVYAASFIRERRIVLDSGLLREPVLLQAILLHELFHFVWAKLGNSLRASFLQLLSRERIGRARGELGESSGVAKSFVQLPGAEPASPAWKQYVCESFCDTAAFLLTGSPVGQTRPLSKRWLARRRNWFTVASGNGWKL